MSSDRGRATPRERNRRLAVLAAVLALAQSTALAVDDVPSRLTRVEIDAARSVVAFRLAGSLHDTHGTFALTRAALEVDEATGTATGTVVVDATSAKTGIAARDRKMKDVVLEAEKYPEITFRPGRIEGHLAEDGSFRGMVHGVLALHGADHSIAFETTGSLAGEELSATCRFSVPYLEWGLTDPSVLLLRVAKQVDIDVKLVGRVVRGTSAEEGRR